MSSSRCGLDTQGGQVVIAVEDTGIGVSSSKIDAIFGRFIQADTSTTRNYGGTGLGLSICQRITQMLDGTLSCHSELNKGSTFTLTLPLKVHHLKNTPPSVLAHQTDLYIYSHGTPRIHQAIGETLKAGGQVICPLEQWKDRPLKKFKRIFYASDSFKKEVVKAMAKEHPNLTLIYCGLSREQCLIEQQKLERSILFFEESFNLSKILGVTKEDGESQESHDSKSKGHSGSKASAQHKKVLLAEDNEINRIVAVDLMKTFGASVDVAHDGVEALELFDSKKDYDLIFLDCLMPRLDGFETLKIMKRKDPSGSVKIIALTANAMKGDREKCLQAGFDDYLPKPIRANDLKRILNC